jgi:hypothetical protein
MAAAQLRTFSAFRAVEDNPRQQVFSEVLKAMVFPGGGKKRVSGAKLKALTFDAKPAASGDNNIKFIARVRLLQINAFGRVDFNRQGAMAEEFGIEFTVARWNGVLRIGKFDLAFRREFHFVSPLEFALIRALR